MKKMLLVMAVVCSFIGTSFAASDPCKEKTEAAKKLLAKCKAIGKGNSGYEQCANSYKTAKNSAEQACRSGSVDAEEMEKAIQQWSKLNEKCKNEVNERCATSLFNLGNFQYKLEEKHFIDKETDYEADQNWCDDRDGKGTSPHGFNCATINNDLPKPDHNKSLGYFLEFIEKYPKNGKITAVMYQSAALLEANGDEEKAFKLRMKLVNEHPKDGYAPKCWLRIAEYYFMNRKFKDAISAYKKVTDFDNLVGKEAALAMYHLAEAYYETAEFETAAIQYFNYIVGADKGKYPADLRTEAMDFMAASFSDLDGGGVAEAEAFLKDKKVAFKDSLYFRIGMKNKDHDRNDEAIESFNRLMKINPDYIDAPLADIAMVQILELQKKPELAQEHRYDIVKRYDRKSSWYKKNQKYPESVKNAETAIRGAMLDIPQYHHALGDKKTKEGDIEEGKRQYKQAIDNYEKFLARYKNEPTWDEFRVHMFMAMVYQQLNQFDKAAGMYNWIVDADTSKYGRRPQDLGTLLTKDDAGYNAVIMMDKGRELAQKNKAGDDPIKAYDLPETKKYFEQVKRYMAKFGKNKEAAEIAYNAALIHYNAKKYNEAITALVALKKDFPKHEQILTIVLLLGDAYYLSDRLDEAMSEYEWLYAQYSDKKKPTYNDSMAKDIEQSIMGVLFKKANKSVESGKYEQGAEAFLALQKRYPNGEFADKAVWEAADAYEKANKFAKAAETFMMLPKNYAGSPLTIKGIVRAAGAYKKESGVAKNAKDRERYMRDAANTYLFITNNFPQDSMAITAIEAAANTFDSIPDKKTAAMTFEIAYKNYHKHERTPSYLYSACLLYDEAKMMDEAIRCNKDLVRDYPKSSYALDAAFSIPVAYQNAQNWDLAAQEYHTFIKSYPEDKEKLIAAYVGAARSYWEMKEVEKAIADYDQTLKSYDKFGLQLKNADPAIPAEAAFYLGESIYGKMDPIEIKGKPKDKEKAIKQLNDLLAKAMEHYTKSATYASAKWTFKASNKLAMLYVTIAKKIREQELSGKSEEEQLAERIVNVQALPQFYEDAIPVFDKNISLARNQNFYNQDVTDAEEGYIEMFYQAGAVYLELNDIFSNAPAPDSAAIVQEYIEYDGMVEEDAAEAAHEDMEAFREDVQGRGDMAKKQAADIFSNGIKAAQAYEIDNQWTTKLFESLRGIDENNEALSIKLVKYDPKAHFYDEKDVKDKARIENIAKSDAMTLEEKFKTFNEIVKEAKAENAKLKKQLEELKKQRRSHAPAPEAAADGMN